MLDACNCEITIYTLLGLGWLDAGSSEFGEPSSF